MMAEELQFYAKNGEREEKEWSKINKILDNAAVDERTE